MKKTHIPLKLTLEALRLIKKHMRSLVMVFSSLQRAYRWQPRW